MCTKFDFFEGCMIHTIQFIFTKNGLCLQFQTLVIKDKFIKLMKTNGINLFTEEDELRCSINWYTKLSPTGQFVSHEGRVALIFNSEEQKFFFKETSGLRSEHFMDLGPGYDTQLHFNTNFILNREGEGITTDFKFD